MRRLRRNSYALTAREPAVVGAKESWSLSGLTVIGLVANPKTHEPALVVTDGEYVSLRGLSGQSPLQRLGRGYYEEHRNEPSRVTDFPRSHTPDGVLIKGKGWGTSLYTALALGAHQTAEELVEIAMYKPGNGICSWTNDRSAEADRWWEAAVKLGLADQQIEEEEETEEDVDLDLSPSDLDEFVSEGEVVRVNTVNVDVEKKTEVTVEAYSYNEASDRRHLVGVAMNVEIPKGLDAPGSLEVLWRAISEDSDLVTEADPYCLLALDVRGLTGSAILLLSLCFGEAGLDDAARDELHLRHERGLDPAMPSGQGRLFKANQLDMSDVILAREAGGWAKLAALP
jgi:hypothetical protein